VLRLLILKFDVRFGIKAPCTLPGASATRSTTVPQWRMLLDPANYVLAPQHITDDIASASAQARIMCFLIVQL